LARACNGNSTNWVTESFIYPYLSLLSSDSIGDSVLDEKVRGIVRRMEKNIRDGRLIVNDMDCDGKPEIAFLMRGRYLRTYYGDREYVYELVFVDSIESGHCTETVIKRFEGKPEGLMIDDVDGDRIPDIVYLKRDEYLCISHGNVLFLYRLMLMHGRGNGKFDEPREIASLKGLPEKV
jgi:hypothetical protein